ALPISLLDLKHRVDGTAGRCSILHIQPLQPLKSHNAGRREDRRGEGAQTTSEFLPWGPTFSQQRLTSFAHCESAWRTANTGSSLLCLDPVSKSVGTRRSEVAPTIEIGPSQPL